jgi:hypothetical protein
MTAGVWNEQVTYNMAFLGNTHDHSGDAGDGSLYALLPQGIILIADAACPSGWTRVSAFDGLFVRGASSYGGTGGGGTHSHSHLHTVSSHGHDQMRGTQNQVIDAGTRVAAAAFANSVMSQSGGGGTAWEILSGFLGEAPALGTNAATATVTPAYINVIFCKKN